MNRILLKFWLLLLFAASAFATSITISSGFNSVPTNRLLRRVSAGTGTAERITLRTNLSFAVSVLNSTIPNLPASQTTSEVFSTGILGMGTANSTNFLRGDGTWATQGGGGSGLPTQIKVANDHTGADLGAKINTADRACGLNVGCEIWVFDGGSVGANTMTSQPIITSGHTLRFHAGTFYMGFYSQIGSMLVQDNAKVLGNGSSVTTLVELDDPNVSIYNPATDTTTNNVAGYRMIAAYNLQFICNLRFGSNANTCRTENIEVSGIHFKGVRSNIHDGGVAGSVNLGHCWGCRITQNWFDEVAGYAAHFGSTQSDVPGDSETPVVYGGRTYYAANFAKDVWFTDNLITNHQSQGFAIITAENAHVERNIFRGAGKRPFTIANVSNLAGVPIVITMTENPNFYSNVGVKLLGVTSVGGSPAINPATIYYVRPIGGSRNSFYIRATAGGPAINGTGTGNYTVTSASKTDLQGIFVVGIDLEPNGSSFERANSINFINNTFDYRNCNGVYVTAIVWQVTARGISTTGGRISGNTILGNETGTGALSAGIQLLNPYNMDVRIDNNFIKKALNIGLQVQGDRIFVTNNLFVDSGGGGSGTMQVTATNSTFSGNVARNISAVTNSIREVGINTTNLWTNNRFTFQYHETGSTVTNSRYMNNYWADSMQTCGFHENTNSNNNLYDGNITRPRYTPDGAYGLVIVGAGSKVLSHKYTDGRTFITNINGTSVPFTNPN